MVNHNLPERNCYNCEIKFSPFKETIFCRECFDSPNSYQHACHAMEEYAKKLGKKDIDLTQKEIEEIPKLSDEEIGEIREEIYGKI